MQTRQPSSRPTQWVLVTVMLEAWLCSGSSAFAEDKPLVIRIANPGVGNGGRPVVAYGAWSLLHIKGVLEDEFKADGIPVTWTFARGAGPAVNEMYANDLADISLLGDLPSIIGKASGLNTRMLVAAGLDNIYVAVRDDLQVTKLEELAGKRIAVFKGTCNHLSANRIFAAHGISEQQLHMINMDDVTQLAALNTKDIDVAIGGAELLALRDRGVANILYSTKGDPRFTCNSTLIEVGDRQREQPDRAVSAVHEVWHSVRELQRRLGR
jgi:sulfonate transport system substrate-binding protein